MRAPSRRQVLAPTLSSRIVDVLTLAPEMRSAEEFCERLACGTPTDVVDSLRSIAGGAGRLATPASRLLEVFASAPDLRVHVPQGCGLPLPHPSDAEWRFSDQTVGRLLTSVIEATCAGDTILFHGTPSMAAAAHHSAADRRFRVAGVGNVVDAAVSALTCDDPRFADPQDHLASAAIVDPPWYVDAYAQMLPDCTSRCRTGAHILLVMPPHGLRDSIADDRARIGRIAEAAGLVAVGSEPAGVAYRSPVFEIAAFEAAGLNARFPYWRKGDLMTFVKGADVAGGVRRAAPPAFELTVEGIRLRLLGDVSARKDGLRPVARGEVFPSVSARAPGRRRANLWTSTNRAFEVDAVAVLRAMAVLAARREVCPPGLRTLASSAAESPSVDPIHSLIHELEALVEREIADAGRLAGEASWTRSIDDARFLGACWSTSLGPARGPGG